MRHGSAALVCTLIAGLVTSASWAQSQNLAGLDNLHARFKDVQEVHDDYGRCILRQIGTGSKIDLDEAVVDAAATTCRAEYNRFIDTVQDRLPIEARQQVKHAFVTDKSKPEKAREFAVSAAVSTYFKSNAGGQPAVSTARSK